MAADNLYELFKARYDHPRGRRICQEVAQACWGCQKGSDYHPRKATAGIIQAQGPWDTLSVDVVGPLPKDQGMEFVVAFVDVFFRYTILVVTKDHTAPTVVKALLERVIPYFGVPRRMLSDRGRDSSAKSGRNSWRNSG